MKYLTEPEHWKQQQGSANIEIDRKSCIYKWIQEKFPFIASAQSCIEIGCYPGRYLSIFAEKGIEVNGIDYIENLPEVPKLMTEKGYRVGDFFCTDFHGLDMKRVYDLVCSFGFIEHFDDWEETLLKHCRLVSNKGYLLVEVPNYRGWMQRVPRFIFDQKSYKMHNINSMNPALWKKLLEDQGFRTLAIDYIGGYILWFNRKPRKAERIIRSLVVKCMQLTKRVLYKGENHPSFSAAIILLAKREMESQ